MMRNILIVLCLLGALCVSAVELVRDGQAAASIRVADGAPDSVRFAAEELQHYIYRATKAKLPVIGQKDENTLPNEIKLGYGTSVKGLGRFGFVVEARGNELVLCGFDHAVKEFKPEKAAEQGMITASTGTLFAVYDFLDRELGVRFLWPGETGTYVPHRDSIILPDFKRTGKPALESATFRIVPKISNPNGWKNQEAREAFLGGSALWTIRHRFASVKSIRGGHAFTNYWERFSKTHPEFFALLPDGTRRPLKGDKTGRDISMCVSNPDFQKQVVEDFRKKPKEVLSACENDTAGFCTCPQCRSWDAPQPGFATHPYWSKGIIPIRENRNSFMRVGEDGGKDESGASLTDRYAMFYLKVYDLAKEVKPDVIVYGHAYANFARPPLRTKLHRNIAIGYVGWPYYPFTGDEMARIRREWQEWQASGPSMVLRPNSTHSGHNMPLQYARKLGNAYKECFESGAMVGADFDMMRGEFAAQGPMLYTLARLTARPDLTVEQILDEYYGAFGSAAGEVKAYFDYCENISDAVTMEQWNQWKSELGSISFKNWLNVSDRIFTPEFFTHANDLLKKAEAAAAKDPETLERVKFLQLGLENANLTVKTLLAKRSLDASSTAENRAKWQESLKALAAFRAAHEDQYISNMGYLYYREKHGSKLYDEVEK